MTLTRRTVKSKTGVTMTVTYDVATPEEIRSVLWKPGGPGDTDLKRRATAVMQVAAQTAPVGKGPTSGMVKRSFQIRQSREVSGRFDSGYEVINTAPHFLYVVLPTRPHEIVGNPLLVFDWPKGGLHPAVFRRVNHPGTPGNTFFADAIRAAV